MTILITGGLGYIGSHTAVVFANAGYDVVIVDNLSNTDIGVLEKINTLVPKPVTFYQCDLRDKIGLSKIFDVNKIDGVIHFAAFKAVGESCEKPFLYYDNNIGGGNCLYETMQTYGVRKVVFSSSCTVYNTVDNQPPYDESTSLKTINPYGSTKLIAEIILQDLSTHLGFQTIALRYFNPIGAHPSGVIGENPGGVPSNLLPYIYGVLLGTYEHLSVWGDDYPTPDGTCVRDYLHVMDLAEAHLKTYELLKMKDEGKSFDVINLGTGEGTSVMEMIQLTEKATGKKLPYKLCPKRAGDATSVYANPQKAHDVLGRKATRSVEDAIRDGWKFIQSQ
ncbi:MAG: UDP-glucose 4-epimerase GalE [candidate division SR1 bacterium]|nr:UDP-glucose 4-epimerase GalE [candidate division SR1 bacterium]